MNSEKLVKSISDNLKSFFIENRFHKRKDETFVVEINSQKDVRNFMDNFSLLHPKWLQLRFLLAAKAPNLLGNTRPSMVGTMGSDRESGRQSPKSNLSSDRGL